MDTAQFYGALYSQLCDRTPLSFDCGRLCGRACCAVSPALPGMYLFPGEEQFLAGIASFGIQTSDLPGYGTVYLLNCAGQCDRQFRPLACRVFPLAPIVTGDTVKARLDPRGRPVCPLCHQSRSGLSSAFVQSVEAVFTALLQNPETAPMLRALSLVIDQYDLPLL